MTIDDDDDEKGEDEKDEIGQNFLSKIRSREKIEEYITNRDRSKLLINF